MKPLSPTAGNALKTGALVVTLTGRVSVLEDQCRHAALCGDDTPAPNETSGTVAHQPRMCKQFCQSISADSVTQGFSSPHPLVPVAPRSQYGSAFLAALVSSHSVRVGTFSSRPLSERASSVRPGGGFPPFGRAVNHKDRYQRAPFSGGNTPAPDETKVNLTNETNQVNSTGGRFADACG
jgi:hypothetical protein